MNSPISVLLDPEQSEILADVGSCFLVIHKAMRSEQPDINGRMLLSIVPCTTTQADAAARVAIGLSAERKPRTPKS